MRAVLNRKLGLAVKATWDGRRIRRVAGVLTIAQRLLREYVRTKARLERVAGLVDSALLRGAAVEAGPLDAGLYGVSERRPNWRAAYVAVRGEAAAERISAATPVRVAARSRVHVRGEKPDGTVLSAAEARRLRQEKPRKRRSA